MHYLEVNLTFITAIITGGVTVLVALVGVLGNWYQSNQNKKKEIEQQEYQFLLENLKGFWEHQNKLYTETLKVVSTLVLNEDIQSEEFLSAYKRFWELYWCELPTCESAEISAAMLNLKQKVYDKKHLDPNDQNGIRKQKEEMNRLLLDLAKAVRHSSLPLEYAERIRDKFRAVE